MIIIKIFPWLVVSLFLICLCCCLEGPDINNTKRCKQFIFTEIQTVTVIGNWRDSIDLLIESVTIYRVGKGSCRDVMGYITITSPFFTLARMEWIFFSFGCLSQLHPLFLFFFYLLCSGAFCGVSTSNQLNMISIGALPASVRISSSSPVLLLSRTRNI